MSADIKQPSKIEVLEAANPLNSGVFAFTLSTSSVLRRVGAVPERSWPSAGEHEQVIGEHPQPGHWRHLTGTHSPSVSCPDRIVTPQEKDRGFSHPLHRACVSRGMGVVPPRTSRSGLGPPGGQGDREIVRARRECPCALATSCGPQTAIMPSSCQTGRRFEASTSSSTWLAVLRRPRVASRHRQPRHGTAA